MKKMIPKNKSQGFTIIEVLIVLAIAGLMIAVVLFAVPALNRNSRNTAIKNDAQAFIGGISEYMSANDGALPASISKSTDSSTVDYGAASGVNPTTAKLQGSTTVTPTSTAPSDPEVATLYYALKYQCDGHTALKANNRSVAVFYVIETTGNKVLQCVNS